MSKIIFKKLHKDATIPTRGTDGAAGFDLYASEDIVITGEDDQTISTGVAVHIPSGFVGLIKDRSSIATKGFSTLGGVIDSDYRGEIKVIIKDVVGCACMPVIRGFRIAQIIFVPILTDFEAGEIDETVRGSGGFGSTGK